MSLRGIVVGGGVAFTCSCFVPHGVVVRGGGDAPAELQARSSMRWNELRPTLLELFKQGTSELSLVSRDSSERVDVHTANSRALDPVETLVVVDVVGREHVLLGNGVVLVSDLAGSAAAYARMPTPRFLVRAEDPAQFGDVIQVLRILETVAPNSTILGALRLPKQSPENDWACLMPPAAEAAGSAAGVVHLDVDLDDSGRVSVVHACQCDQKYGFAGAAAVCAAKQRYEPARDAAGRPIPYKLKPIRMRFEK